MDLGPLTQNPTSSTLALLCWVVVQALWVVVKKATERPPEEPVTCRCHPEKCETECKWTDSDREAFLKHTLQSEQVELKVRDIDRRVSKIYVMLLLMKKRGEKP